MDLPCAGRDAAALGRLLLVIVRSTGQRVSLKRRWRSSKLVSSRIGIEEDACG